MTQHEQCVSSSRSVNKESIVDIHAKIVPVNAKIESCTEQSLELSVLEIYLISSAKPQLPLQIEDASRPEKSDVSDEWAFIFRSEPKLFAFRTQIA